METVEGNESGYAWLAPVLCVGAFFFNVLIARQLGRLKHGLAAFVSIAAIPARSSSSWWSFATRRPTSAAPARRWALGASSWPPLMDRRPEEIPRHLLFDSQPWFTVGR